MTAKILGTALAAAIAVGGIGYCPVPWACAMLAVAALAAIAAWVATRNGTKIVMANIAAVFFALAAFEGYLGHQSVRGDGTRMEGTITEGFTHRDDVLGYAPDPGRRVTARKRYGDAVLYDVTYTIGTDGLRLMPRPNNVTPTSCVVFFGDSVTFGEGVNDDEAFPYLVGRSGDGARAAYNFAFSGYGPHQMLAALQAGFVESKTTCRPTQFIYTAILEHIARVAGLAPWDRHGPRFRLEANGTPIRDANFDSPIRLGGRWVVPAPIVDALDGLRTWQRFFGRSRDPVDADVALFLGVIVESARLARAKYPGSTFQVILWDGRDDARIETIVRRLTLAGIPVERLTSAIPDFTADASRYILSPHDGHPNPLMHQRLAEYFVHQMTVAPGR